MERQARHDLTREAWIGPARQARLGKPGSSRHIAARQARLCLKDVAGSVVAGRGMAGGAEQGKDWSGMARYGEAG